MKRIKLVAILVFFVLVGVVLHGSRQFLSQAKGDDVLEEIAKYKTWTKVSKEDEKTAVGSFRVTDSSVAG